MSCPIGAEAVEKLKQFVTICQSNPDLLHLPQLSFFKSFIESFGGKVPAPRMSAEPNAQQAQPEPKEEAPESDEESDLEIDMTGCVESDEISPDHNMGDVTKEEVSEEEQDKADEKRREAMAQFSEGNIEKSIELFTKAIVINPTSALLFAKRGQAYLKLNKPNACIKDCTRALELNCDSVSGYKFRGKAYRLLGEWEKAAKDLRQACNIDFDEQTDEWLKEVEPNAKKIEQHRLKKERREKEKKAQKARAPKPEAPPTSTPGGPPPAGAGPGGLFDLFKDPEILKAFEVSLKIIMQNKLLIVLPFDLGSRGCCCIPGHNFQLFQLHKVPKQSKSDELVKEIICSVYRWWNARFKCFCGWYAGRIWGRNARRICRNARIWGAQTDTSK